MEIDYARQAFWKATESDKVRQANKAFLVQIIPVLVFTHAAVGLICWLMP